MYILITTNHNLEHPDLPSFLFELWTWMYSMSTHVGSEATDADIARKLGVWWLLSSSTIFRLSYIRPPVPTTVVPPSHLLSILNIIIDPLCL